MREIKFRIYDKELKETHIERLQDLCEDDYWYDGETEVWSVLKDCNDKQERFVALQYTGLKDKNGKEIYEGDIVQHFYEYSDVTDRYLVDYDEDELSYVFQKLSNKNNFIALEDLYDEDYGDYAVEIIGNIYQNPELLERS